MLSQEIIKEAQALSNEDKLCLIAAMLDVDPDTDGSASNQLVFYTGMRENEDGEIVDL